MAVDGAEDDRPWYETAVIYQIYPRSFQDSGGDGIGDLDGIVRRLGHLVDLGVDAIWLSPIFASPMADFGYDISDYRAIDPIFGDLGAFDRLLASAHDAGLRVLLDLVPSHTSDRHAWFRESRADRRSAKRDWYVWAEPDADGGPPNNWVSEFGGPAWSFDPGSGQYYLHLYLDRQPALNWHNPQVRAAIFDVMRFWFNRGVDGFRVDAVEHLVTDAHLRDNPPNPDWVPHLGPARRHIRLHTSHQPETYAHVRAMRSVADAYPGRVLIGEAYGTLEEVMAYYGTEADGFHLPFNFTLLTAPWSSRDVAAHVEAYEAALPPDAWPNWVLGNHDRSRIASRVGPVQARIAAMLLLTLRGTPTIYQGDELGLPDGVIPADAVRDPWERNVPGEGLGRDPARTPMLWDDTRHAGFTSVEPWLPLSPGRPWSRQAGNGASMLSLYRDLLSLRRNDDRLSAGGYRTVAVSDHLFVYERGDGGSPARVALNFGDGPAHIEPYGRLTLSSDPSRRTSEGATTLRAHEGVILTP